MRRRGLGANIVVSAANVVAVVGASLLAVPLLVDRLGLAGYGIWTLAQALVIYVTAAELGFGPALARYTSVRRADRTSTRQVLVAALVLYACVGALFVVGFHLAAAPLVDLFDVPARYRADAEATVGLMGWVSLVALLAGALGHILSGLERFTAFTATNAAGSAAFLVALAVGLSSRAQLQDAGYAALIQWGLVAVLRLGVLREVLIARRGWRPDRALVRELVGYSARLQAATVATLLNTQTDRVVVGLVAPATTLGQVSIATQVAEAGRFLAYAAFSPLAARMAVRYGEEGPGGLDDELQRTRHAWTIGVVGVVAVGLGAIVPVIEAWVGRGHRQAAGYAALLLVAYGVGLLPSPAFAYLRAIGRPTLEGLFGLVTVALNLVLTVALGVAFGATGVVAATTAAYLASTAWVATRTRRAVPAPRTEGASPARLALAALVAGALAYGAGEALGAAFSGAVTLVLLAPALLAIAAGYASIALATTPARALQAVRDPRGAII